MTQLRVSVELPGQLDAVDWSARHDRGEVPDHLPYGLDKLAAHGVRPVVRRPLTSDRGRWVARKVRNRTDGLEIVDAVAGRTRRGEADAVLCMDERTGIPAVLLPRGAPVVSGVAWIDRPRALHPARRRLVSLALPRAAALFTNVAALVPVVTGAWDLPSGSLHVVPLGIDEGFFPAQPWPERPGLVVSAGEDRMRDHATLVTAVLLAHAQEPTTRLELATRMPVPDLPDLLTVHRRRMNGEMRGLYRRATVVAVALHENPLGSGLTVVLEAMASARPIVVTDNPGMDEYVEHGVTGLLVPPGDPVALAEAVRGLVRDPDRAREMGLAGRAAVERWWTTDRMAASLADLLRSVA